MFIWCIRKPALYPFCGNLGEIVPAAVATDASLANQLVCTLPETHIASENGWLEDCFPIGLPIFRGYVSFREAILK